jgi:prepilin-type N-terminal cleavage/methylation domain-containing protein
MVTTINAQTNKGFTLIELLVVIAIIGVLAAVVLLAINPAELLRRSRDSTRLSDLSSLRKAIDATFVDGAGALVLPCTTVCSSTTTTAGKSAVGTGWIGAAGGTFDMTRYISTLPSDPVNAATTVACNSTITNGGGTCTTNRQVTVTAVYQFISATDGTYELDTVLESTQNLARLNTDGGNDANRFETGTDPSLDLLGAY